MQTGAKSFSGLDATVPAVVHLNMHMAPVRVWAVAIALASAATPSPVRASVDFGCDSKDGKLESFTGIRLVSRTPGRQLRDHLSKERGSLKASSTGTTSETV